ncbi:hypothetical protein NDU88_007297 [Pleurodeles waltl]|uniref:Uncharacterized protein n=1 Tax=Pleurodeles waltl TaxID=8319 RepID=A0AAV7NB40_PLEWA|nr:hypothetical protein NDU88_007297 [Pleurodeles waltl]
MAISHGPSYDSDPSTVRGVPRGPRRVADNPYVIPNPDEQVCAASAREEKALEQRAEARHWKEPEERRVEEPEERRIEESYERRVEEPEERGIAEPHERRLEEPEEM